MTTLSRIRAARITDTMPAPPPSSSRTPTGSNPESLGDDARDDDTGPASRVDSRRSRDTLPAPPPSEPTDPNAEGITDEEPPSTERTPFAVDQVS